MVDKLKIQFIVFPGCLGTGLTLRSKILQFLKGIDERTHLENNDFKLMPCFISAGLWGWLSLGVGIGLRMLKRSGWEWTVSQFSWEPDVLCWLGEFYQLENYKLQSRNWWRFFPEAQEWHSDMIRKPYRFPSLSPVFQIKGRVMFQSQAIWWNSSFVTGRKAALPIKGQ